MRHIIRISAMCLLVASSVSFADEGKPDPAKNDPAKAAAKEACKTLAKEKEISKEERKQWMKTCMQEQLGKVSEKAAG